MPFCSGRDDIAENRKGRPSVVGSEAPPAQNQRTLITTSSVTPQAAGGGTCAPNHNPQRRHYAIVHPEGTIDADDVVQRNAIFNKLRNRHVVVLGAKQLPSDGAFAVVDETSDEAAHKNSSNPPSLLGMDNVKEVRIKIDQLSSEERAAVEKTIAEARVELRQQKAKQQKLVLVDEEAMRVRQERDMLRIERDALAHREAAALDEIKQLREENEKLLVARTARNFSGDTLSAAPSSAEPSTILVVKTEPLPTASAAADSLLDQQTEPHAHDEVGAHASPPSVALVVTREVPRTRSGGDNELGDLQRETNTPDQRPPHEERQAAARIAVVPTAEAFQTKLQAHTTTAISETGTQRPTDSVITPSAEQHAPVAEQETHRQLARTGSADTASAISPRPILVTNTADSNSTSSSVTNARENEKEARQPFDETTATRDQLRANAERQKAQVLREAQRIEDENDKMEAKLLREKEDMEATAKTLDDERAVVDHLRDQHSVGCAERDVAKLQMETEKTELQRQHSLHKRQRLEELEQHMQHERERMERERDRIERERETIANEQTALAEEVREIALEAALASTAASSAGRE